MPIKRDELRDRKTFLGIFRRGGEIVTELEFAEFLMQLAPCIHRSRHTDGEHAARRNCFAVQLVELGFHLLVAQSERRAAAAVQAVELVFLRAVDDREEIAADAVRDRLHQSERGVGRDGGVDGAAAAFQNIESNLGRERHAGANHAVAGDDFGTRGEGLAGDAIDLGRQR